MQERTQRGVESQSDLIRLMSALISGFSDPAIIVGRDLSTRAYNYRFYDLTGKRKHELESCMRAGTSLLELVSVANERDQEHIGRCLRTGHAIHLAEVVVRNQAGDSFVMLQSFIPIPDLDGTTAGVIVIFRDTSGETRMHEAYKELVAKEQARADRLESIVEQRTQELRQALEKVTRLSRTDPLTSTLNRRAFTEYAEDMLRLARRYDHSAGLLMCDLDYFKQINDSLGHQVGDMVLVATAKAIQNSVRVTDRVARFGGEEFVVFLPETSTDAVQIVAQRCREAIREISSGKDRRRCPASRSALASGCTPTMPPIWPD